MGLDVALPLWMLSDRQLFEVQVADELTEEWLISKLGFFR